MKTEAAICTSPSGVTSEGDQPPSGNSDSDLPGPPPPGAKAYDFDGVNDFSFDPPSTKE